MCVMCGAPTQTTAPVPAFVETLSEPNGSNRVVEATIFHEPPQQIEQPGRGKSIGLDSQWQ